MLLAVAAWSSHSGHGPTAADHELARAATAIGPEPVSPSQVKRWREAAQLPTTRRFHGRGRGSDPVEYTPDAAAHAACLARVLTIYTRLEEACLVCFMRGFRPPERTLKRDYAQNYNRLTRWLERRSGGATNPWDIADAVAALLSRRAASLPQLRATQQRLRAAGKPKSSLREVIANMLAVMLGANVQIHPDTLAALGMQGLLAPIGALGTLLTSDDLKLEWFRLSAFPEAVENATLAELEQARDDFTDVSRVARAFALSVTRIYDIRLDLLVSGFEDELGLAALIGVPGLLLMRRRVGAEQIDKNIAILRAELPRAEATVRLLDAMSPDLHRYVHSNAAALAVLPDPTRDRIMTETRAYFDTHPDDLAAMLGNIDSQPTTPP